MQISPFVFSVNLTANHMCRYPPAGYITVLYPAHPDHFESHPDTEQEILFVPS